MVLSRDQGTIVPRRPPRKLLARAGKCHLVAQTVLAALELSADVCADKIDSDVVIRAWDDLSKVPG